MASSGATGLGQNDGMASAPTSSQTVWALMPLVGLSEAVGPMTTIDLAAEVSGSAWPWFLSRTEPCSASCSASAKWAGVDKLVDGDAGSGWSNSPALM